MLDSVKKICKSRGPLLLALSGGPDSTALYHLMLELGHPFEVVHVDHGWREESATEAQALASKVSCPFHLRCLEKAEKNAEDRARQGRLQIYQELIEERNLDGVLVGHHADDQAETVLKRLFEGARLTKLVGLEEERVVGNVLLLRPLLSFRKREILKYLDKKGVDYLIEPPAGDLRSRMRNQLLPTLSEQFGKEVVPALCRIAADARELVLEKESFWLKETVSDFFENQGVALSKPTQSAVTGHILRGSRKKEMIIGKGKVTIDGQKLIYNKRIEEES